MPRHGLFDSLWTRVYGPRLKDVLHRFGLEAHVRALYVTLYRIRYGNSTSLEVGPASADIAIGSASELSTVRSILGKEREVARTIVEELGADDVFWDVGANVGTFSCLAGDVMDGGTVVAFEPYPPNVERLQHNLERNDTPYRLEPRALTDSTDEQTFFVMGTDEPGTREGSIDERYPATDSAVERISVGTTTGDHVVEEGALPPPDVVKIDVEGAAPNAITGMREILDRPECRLVVVEPHDNEDTIVRLLEAAGFQTCTLDVEGSSRIVATPRTGTRYAVRCLTSLRRYARCTPRFAGPTEVNQEPTRTTP